MATWFFRPPARLSIPYEQRPGVVSLFTRVKFNRGSAVVQLTDDSWEEWEGHIPQTRSPRNRYYLAPEGFTDQDNQSASYDELKRYYLGGHVYRLTDALKTELEAAVTTQEAGGYGAYITADDGSLDHLQIGDEITISGRRWGND